MVTKLFLPIVGVVFNEMKGVYSQPDNILGRTAQQASSFLVQLFISEVYTLLKLSRTQVLSISIPYYYYYFPCTKFVCQMIQYFLNLFLIIWFAFRNYHSMLLALSLSNINITMTIHRSIFSFGRYICVSSRLLYLLNSLLGQRIISLAVIGWWGVMLWVHILLRSKFPYVKYITL